MICRSVSLACCRSSLRNYLCRFPSSCRWNRMAPRSPSGGSLRGSPLRNPADSTVRASRVLQYVRIASGEDTGHPANTCRLPRVGTVRGYCPAFLNPSRMCVQGDFGGGGGSGAQFQTSAPSSMVSIRAVAVGVVSPWRTHRFCCGATLRWSSTLSRLEGIVEDHTDIVCYGGLRVACAHCGRTARAVPRAGSPVYCVVRTIAMSAVWIFYLPMQ